MRRSWILAAVSAILAWAATGCGSRTFTPSEFIDQANRNGAGIDLGGPLITNQPDKKTYGVTMRLAPGDAPGGAGGGTQGSISVYDGVDGASRGTAECHAATGLLCFQAGNVVLIFEGDRLGPAQVRLATAIKKMAG